MQVFKFGGASVNSAERILNVAGILKKYKGEKLLVVISAMGKTTNALEKVVAAFYAGNNDEALKQFEQIKQQHIGIAEQLSNNGGNQLLDFFTEVEWLLHDQPVQSFDYYYDQVVCVGELLSTSIISHFLQQQGIKNKWVDVRDVLRTDDNFRDAQIDWTITAQKVAENVQPIFNDYDVVITQGFIGATDENESTTLGREGSDYTAAVFANLLNATNQTIWKDVPGVMNADPKKYKDAQLIKELNYKEVIEMAFYGAQVIHPKTIKPLQNKGIPLYVKSFLDYDEDGTCIHSKAINNLPPIIVYKEKQVLVQMSTRDFSFVAEGLSSDVSRLFEEIHVKPNLSQNAAISLLNVLDDNAEKIDRLAFAASQVCDVQITRGLTLLTIRHFNNEILEGLTKGKTILLRQQTPETVQVVMS